MFIRFRTVPALVLLLSLLISVTASAKGGFDYITISGPGLEEVVTVTDTALTEDFFTFANFHENKTEAPASPGEGYEILRYYKEGIGARAFDRLHYYPESGFVFYDGIENGESEYDGGWYTANSGIKPLFESAIGIKTSQAASQPRTEGSVAPSQPAATGIQSPALISILVASGLVAFVTLAALALRRRRLGIQQ